MNKAFLILFFLSSMLNSTAQELSGIWKGQLTQGPGGCFPVYNIELQIQITGTRITGASYHYSDLSNYVKEEFTGTYNPERKTMEISEMRVLTFKVPPDCIPCIKTYTLAYLKQVKNEFLNGDWGGVTMNNQAACPPGKIVLTRALESAFKD